MTRKIIIVLLILVLIILVIAKKEFFDPAVVSSLTIQDTTNNQGIIRATDSSGNLIGFRIFKYTLPAGSGSRKVKLIDPSNNSYNTTDWVLIAANNINDYGTYVKFWPKEIITYKHSDNFWWLSIGEHNSNSGADIYIICYPSAYFEKVMI